MIIVLWIHVLCGNAPSKHQDQNISLKPFHNEHDSVKESWKKGQKTCIVDPKNSPSKGEKREARKAKEEEKRESEK